MVYPVLDILVERNIVWGVASTRRRCTGIALSKISGTVKDLGSFTGPIWSIY
ncbi:MAG: hypothetical protein NT074_04330 [Methanomicrobiales archaeon]|nr:hypothetical protein [Methanomicrobiales archaeon]